MQQINELSKGDIVLLRGWRGSVLETSKKIKREDVRLISKIVRINKQGEDVDHKVLWSNCEQWRVNDIRSLIDVPERCFWSEVTKISKV